MGSGWNLHLLLDRRAINRDPVDEPNYPTCTKKWFNQNISNNFVLIILVRAKIHENQMETVQNVIEIRRCSQGHFGDQGINRATTRI